MTADELKALRKGAGLTQGEMAEAIGMSEWSIGEMERGNTPIELRTEYAARYAIEVIKLGSGPKLLTEAGLRKMAERKGLRLLKSRATRDLSLYALRDAEDREIESGRTLAEIQDILTNGA